MSTKFQPLDYSRGWDDYWRDHPQGYSPQEQMVNWAGQLNAMIDFFNEYFDVDLTEYATDVMEGWYFDGRLEDIINEALFDSKADKTTVNSLIDRLSGMVNVKSYEHLKNGNDWTPAFNQLIADTPEGYTVKFPTDTYYGHFQSSKAFELDLQNSIIIPIDDNQSVIKFSGSVSPIYKHVMGNPVYGQVSFMVDDVADLNVDDIGYLVDGATRPNDETPDINVELVKIKAINSSTNTITVYDMIRSNQNTGNVKFFKLDNVVKNPKVKNVNGLMTDTHLQPFIYFFACDNPIANNIEVKNFTGNALRFEYCYNSVYENIRLIKPNQVGSGQGYGVCGVKSRLGSGNNLYGEGTRHVLDFSSCYSFNTINIEEVDGKSAPVMLSHNGYGGDMSVEDLKCVVDGYAVSFSSQGISDLDKQCTRDIRIKDVNHVVPTLKTDVYNATVLIQTDFSDVIIENIKTHYIDTTATPTTNSSKVVSLRGNQRGTTIVRNITANQVETLVEYVRRSVYELGDYPFVINTLQADTLNHFAWLRGSYSAEIDNLFSSNDPIISSIFIESHAGVVPFRLSVGENIKVSATPVIQHDGLSATGLLGLPPKLRNNSAGSLSLANNSIITQDKIINSGGFLLVFIPQGSDVTLNATTPFDPPLWVGQELTIVINGIGYTGTRGDLIIPSGSTTYADGGISTTLAKGNVYKLVGYNGRWRVVE